jgi:quinoprotein glucose dehydrogenase
MNCGLTKMKAAGSTPPTIFEVNGKQYLIVLSTGGNYHNYKNESSTIYTFVSVIDLKKKLL